MSCDQSKVKVLSLHALKAGLSLKFRSTRHDGVTAIAIKFRDSVNQSAAAAAALEVSEVQYDAYQR